VASLFALSSAGLIANHASSATGDPLDGYETGNPLDGYEITSDPKLGVLVLSCKPSTRCSALPADEFIEIRRGTYLRLPASVVRSFCNNAALMREAGRQPGELNLVVERAGLQAGICSPDEMNAADWKRP
jgi:hypothetical protein